MDCCFKRFSLKFDDYYCNEKMRINGNPWVWCDHMEMFNQENSELGNTWTSLFQFTCPARETNIISILGKFESNTATIRYIPWMTLAEVAKDAPVSPLLCLCGTKAIQGPGIIQYHESASGLLHRDTMQSHLCMNDRNQSSSKCIE